ncbi:MAG TPA: bifunctional oligoribonuclease/PAP phosphatase NrnA [Flavobacteriales bacterium]|nr:bifunctional oligoribonuclease/PAP phosphatase NrnA [Flavobacteriales bacterium]HRJ35686.1 bifunctional oligoribonuclease/PAP phosphatase NrnA [Flavobacteriales bacterium]HRJ37874.1 bifunctional oligoribonuclease/PAP phosphatase NrnA [Flavobacteriales bacterium]
MIPAGKIAELIAKAEHIVITAHKSPDGDAVGSTLGLFHALTHAGKDCNVILPDGFAQFIAWMPGAGKILLHDKEPDRCAELISQSDLIFCLDYNSLDRTGNLASLLVEATAPRVLIDHHPFPSDEFAVRFSDTAHSSTCEMVTELLLAMDMKQHITRDAAQCLYSGLVTDTGSFRYSCTSPRTHQIAAELIGTGIENAKIHNQLFDTQSEGRLKLLGYALSEKMVVDKANQTAWFVLSKAELKRFNHQKGDTEGLVNYGLAIEGIRAAAIFVEHEDKVKISLRSKDSVPVNLIAKEYFSGGGHTNAAGGIWESDMDSLIEKWKSIYPAFMATHA